MPIVKDIAQVLRVFEYANSSLILVLLGRRLGQVRVLAKGARRMPKKGFEGGFDLLVRGEILLYSKGNDGLWIFKEWDEHLRPPGLGDSLQTLNATSYLCELTEAFTVELAGSAESEDQTHPHTEENALLYDALTEAADGLALEKTRAPSLLRYTLRIMEWAGFLPDFAHCSACRRPFAGKRTRQSGLLSQRGLECDNCVRKALQNREEAARRTAAAHPSNPLRLTMTPQQIQVLLSPETLGALDFLKRTGKSVKFSKQAAVNAARAMVAMIHGALERDLRTLGNAAEDVMRWPG